MPFVAAAGASTTAAAALSLELSTAFCAVAELYMTDLCDVPDAETECLAAIERGCSADPTNPEALQTKARFLVVKEEFEVIMQIRKKITNAVSSELEGFRRPK